MPIWKLSPINLHAEEWELSIYKGVVIVRAMDEDEAHNTASHKFGINGARHTTPHTLRNPWTNPALVQCVQLAADRSWEEDGPPAVLDPAD
jgi:hypothetical protein